MKHLGKRRSFAAVSAIAVVLSCSTVAVALPDQCTFVGTTATCSGNQSQGIFGLPGGLTSLAISNLTAPINPQFINAGVFYSNGFPPPPASPPTLPGASALPLVITTDNSQPITVTSTNGAYGILVQTTGGNGNDGVVAANPPGSAFPLGGTPGGAGGGGGDVTINNQDNITTNSTGRAVNTRAVEFGAEGELAGLQNGDISNLEGVISNVQACGCISLGTIITVAANSDGYPFDLSSPQHLVLSLEQVIADENARITYLTNLPSPDQTSQIIFGAIDILSTGGNGGQGGGVCNFPIVGNISCYPLASIGSGGTGGTGGAITITNNATIDAIGPLVAGIHVVSIGGNGGDTPDPESGGPGIVGYALGGQPGTGGAITITNNGKIETLGASSAGIIAESFGGLAGDGGPVGHSDPNYTPAGGSGGVVMVDNPGIISTNGASAYGILAESLGGAGLSGGDAKAAGGGGNVVVDVSGQITTIGDNAYGVFARSIGGTGGNGSDDGNSGGSGGPSGLVTVTVDRNASVATSGDDAIAIYGQSEGGAGGLGGGSGSDIFFGVSGGGGNGGAGGDVHLSNAGTVTTSGAYAYGLFGQALGGTGGAGGNAAALVSESGGGGGGTPAGNVVIDNSGSIMTSGQGANALYAQSLAGAGGDAGNAGGFVALGGDGGSAAEQACLANPAQCLNGGNVTMTNEGTLVTQGDSATAMFAESIGGGGGNGGNSSGVFTFGGNSGAGGNGGIVVVTNAGTGEISVSGSNGAMGIFAQSVGGGGGNGGNASSFGTEIAFSMGGSGGSGGNGNTVTVTNNGAINVNGYSDTAIFVQSVGGGGGNGGDATALGINGVLSASFAIGGTGGGGGNGGEVSVTNTGTIATAGDFSNAIFVQSVGGGGGHGGEGFSFAAAGGGGDIPAISASVAIGGNGGGGGTGGEVDVTNTGSITTTDWNAMGILAQSVGGGGGDGGSSSARALASAPDGFSFTFSLAIGGNGGSGNNAGPVTVTNFGVMTTFGDLSPAVFAQSVGGGGGNGGDGSAVSESVVSGKNTDFTFSIGGAGGAGGNGGTVDVKNAGSILTMGAMSPGITAQSVGGGGGNGGGGTQESLIPGEDNAIPPEADVNGNISDALKKLLKYQAEAADQKEGDSAFGKEKEKETEGEKPESFGLSLGIGGSGGSAGDGLLVTVTNAGDIATLGWMSDGIFAQSVGGGGGNGGAGTADASGDINIGGGVGGAAGSSSNGGTVQVTNVGDINTYGPISFGIAAQSVGGGGGMGGSGSGSSGIGLGTAGLDVSVGGNGGIAGNGGSVSVQQTGNVVTLGLGSIGIFAQSVGGGGGSAGSGTPDEFNPASIGIGGSAGSSGNGLDVTVTLISGSITTSGDYAHGIFAQSVGGGGGIVGTIEATALVESDPFGGLLPAGTPVPYSLGTIGALPVLTNAGCDSKVILSIGSFPILTKGATNCGNGGNVLVQTNGTITTFGKNAAGIFAQSIGGGGGAGTEQTPGALASAPGVQALLAGNALISSNGGIGTAGTVTVDHSGNIEATGEDSIGIFAQSMNGVADMSATSTDARGADISVTVNGVVEGGSGAGAGIFMSGGDQNTLTINSGGNVGALSGLAIIASDGDDTVDNFGTVTGNVGLGAGANAFINEQSGLFQSGPFVYIGAGNTLTNKGTLSPGSAGTIATTTIVGNYIQTSTGVLLVDLDYASGRSDLVVVNGNASLAGKAEIVPMNVTDLKPGDFFTVLTATGSLMNNGISIGNTLTVDYGVKFLGSSFQVGVTAVHFDIGGPLNLKEQTIADNIQTIWAAGGGGMTPFLNYLSGLTDPHLYQLAIDQLDPSTSFGQKTASLFAGLNATNTLMSCPGTEDAEDALHEHECIWARASGGTARSTGFAGQPGFNSSNYEYVMGQQMRVAPEWFLGLAADYSVRDTSVSTLAHEGSREANLGAVAKHETGNWLFAGAIDLQYGSNSLTRFVGFPAPTTTATSSPNDLLIDGRLRVTYLASSGDIYFKPWIAGDGYYADTFAFNESGAGPLDLEVASSKKTFGSGTVGIETGLVEAISRESSMRPYVSADVTAFTDSSWRFSARFAGAPPATPNFAIATKFPNELVRVAGGLEVNVPGGSIRLEYENRFGDHYSEQTGSLKLRFPL